MSAPMTYLICCALLLAASGYMIFAHCYDDGLVGKLFLIVVFFGAFSVLSTAWLEQRLPTVLWQSLVIIAGMCGVIARHLWRFAQYRRRERRAQQ